MLPILAVPVKFPAVAAVHRVVSVQVAPGDSVDEQVCDTSEKPLPVRVGAPEKFTMPRVPVLRTVCTAVFDEPTVVEACGVVVNVAVADRIVAVATLVWAPAPVGAVTVVLAVVGVIDVYVVDTVQLAPTAKVAPQLWVGAVKAVPVRVMVPRVNEAVPVLDNVAVQVDTSPV